eukprot:TRINITY_DN4135_c0_g1_i1.p1 TRINITY_DN4135_c0_g1~~TRINITY_DN4135_c0_g1_i1.p1  ORF type:complete len:387 (-),score=122.02 TRINITY_DN4135_c0_g1_i1:7-1167(-)
MKKEEGKLKKKARNQKRRQKCFLRKKKETIEKAHQELRKKREEELKKQKLLLLSSPSISQEQYLYKKLEDRFEKEVLSPMLEEKKQELAKKRNLCKSMTKEELLRHNNKYNFIASEKEEQRIAEFKRRKKQEERLVDVISNYQTRSIEKVNKQDFVLKKAKEDEKRQKKEKREKMENYSTLVKETLPIEVSEEKGKKLKSMIEKLHHVPREHRDIRKQYELACLNHRKKELAAHSSSVGYMKKENLEALEKHQDQPLAEKKEAIAKKMEVGVQMNEMTRYKTEESKKNNIDYLTKQRLERESNKSYVKPHKHNWKADICDKNLRVKEKFDRVIIKANTIEEDARRKEQMLHCKGGVDKNPEISESISDLYIDAIKAKLAILGHLQQ